MRCPGCSLVDSTQIRLTTVLKQTREKSHLTVALAQDPKPHVCGQLAFTADPAGMGELAGQEAIQW